MPTIQDIIAKGHCQLEDAIQAFDALEPADCDFMLGRWRGAELKTGNPMDGLLQATGWYGKEFIDTDHVHPLVFRSGSGTVNLEPRRLFAGMGIGQRLGNNPIVTGLFKLIKPLLRTQQSRARLRMTDYRGKVSATMVYDHLPINDVFRKVDNNTVLGVMDLKGMPEPYFFILRREEKGV